MNRPQQIRRDARQLFRLCLVDGLLDEERVHRIVLQLARARNRNRLQVLTGFQRLVRLELARHSATVESVVDLPSTVEERIRAWLERGYGPGLDTAFAEQPALLGGIRIQVASDIYDGSVRGRLAELESRI